MIPTIRRIALFGIIGVLIGIAVFPVNAAPARQITSQPRIIVGAYRTTNPIYPAIGADTGVLLYDLAGEITQDFEFVPAVESQVLGEIVGDIVSGSYLLELPAEPQGIPLDFDGDENTPPAIQVYAPALYINYLGDHYINRGEGPLDLSVRIQPLTYDMIGGSVVVWVAQEGALFPSAPGDDEAIFTADDQLSPLPAGWSVIEFDTVPFTVVRDETVDVPMVESLGGLNDYTDMSYLDAWEHLFERSRATYPFTEDKQVDWDLIYERITPLVKAADSDLEFHLVISRFGALLPDTHVGYASLPVMQSLLMGGVGIRQMRVTDAGEVVIVDVNAKSPAGEAGIESGTVLVAMDGIPALQALDETPLLFNSASTDHSRRYLQASTMLQGPIGSSVELTWLNATGNEESASLTRTPDVMALLVAFDSRPPGEGVIASRMLDSGLGYISLYGFAEDVSIADEWFGSELQDLIDAGAKGIIIDVRNNGGGLVQLSMSMAGHFFPDYVRLFDFYYADGAGDFAYRGYIEILKAEPYYDGPVAVLVNEMTGSAGDMFAYAMQFEDRAVIVGHTPTGGFTGEVGDGQYSLPGNLTMQIPTGRPVDPSTGLTLIEGIGVEPHIRVPRTLESLLSEEDEVLMAAEAALLD